MAVIRRVLVALLATFTHMAGPAVALDQVDGTLMLLHEHRLDGTSHYRYSVVPSFGPEVRLQNLSGGSLRLMTGDAVSVFGKRTAPDAMHVQELFLAAAAPELGIAELEAPPPVQRVAVVLVRFAGQSEVLFSEPFVRDTMLFVSDFYEEASYGHTTMTTDIVGPFVTTVPQAGCDVWRLAEDAVRRAGGLGGYHRIMFLFPANPSCMFTGLGTVGGSPSYSWINGYPMAVSVVAHELGHGHGLYHSHGTTCIALDCTRSEYGDAFDVMGSGGIRHFSAPQKQRLGWLDARGYPSTINASAGGTYTIEAMEDQTLGPKALWADVPGRPGARVYVEHRRDEGVSIRRVLVNDPNSYDLLDVNGSGVWWDDTLTVGTPVTTWGVTVTLVTATAKLATINVVTVPPAPPAPAPKSFGDSFDRRDGSLGNGWVIRSGGATIVAKVARTAAIKGRHIATHEGALDTVAAFRFGDVTAPHVIGVVVQYVDDANYVVCLRQNRVPSQLRIVQVAKGKETTLSRADVSSPAKGGLFKLGCKVAGSTVTLSLDGSSRARATISPVPARTKHVGFVAISGAAVRHSVESITSK